MYLLQRLLLSGDATQGKGRTLIALPGHSGDQNKLEISHMILTSCHKRAISLTGLNTHAGVNYFEFIRRISVKSYIFHIFPHGWVKKCTSLGWFQGIIQ